MIQLNVLVIAVNGILGRSIVNRHEHRIHLVRMKWPRALIRCCRRCTCTAGVTLGSVQRPALFSHVVALAAAAKASTNLYSGIR